MTGIQIAGPEDDRTEPARTIEEVKVFVERTDASTQMGVMDIIEKNFLWAIVNNTEDKAYEVWVEGRLHSPCGTFKEADNLIYRLKTGESPWTHFKFYTPPNKKEG
jgi:hypothetical protein